jgi:hypothetical protein
MRLSQVQRMAMPGLYQAHRPTALGLQFLRPATVQTISRRSFWSGLRTFGKTLRELADSWKQRDAVKPKVDDGEVRPTIEPLRPVVFAEPPEMEHSVHVWVSHLQCR